MADVSDDRFLDRLWYSGKTQAATEDKRVSDGLETRQRRFDESLASIRKAAVATRSALEQRLMKLDHPPQPNTTERDGRREQAVRRIFS